MKYKSKGKSLEVAARRERVRELFCKGLRQHEIVTALGLPRGSGDSIVSQDLKAVREAWKASKGLRDFDEAMARQLDKLELLERTLWKAFDRSCRDSSSEVISFRRLRGGGDTVSEPVTKSIDDEGSEQEPPPERENVTTTASIRDGNPAFTNQLLQVIQAQNELLGLTGKDMTGTTSPPLLVFKINQVGRNDARTVESSASVSVPSLFATPTESGRPIATLPQQDNITVPVDEEYEEPDDDSDYDPFLDGDQ